MTCIHPFLGRALGRTVGRAIAIVGVMALTASLSFAQGTSIIDGGGFEPGAGYSTSFLGTGQLEGQPASNPWLRSITPSNFSFGQVQSSVVGSGTQAAQLTRLNGEDTRWGISPGLGWPGQPIVVIDWDMYVQNSNGGAAFGPFFGVEAYDTDGVGFGLLGSLGVDATTGEVLYQAAGTGNLTAPGLVVNFDQWYHFRMVLDFTFDRYRIEVDNVPLTSNIGFVDGANGLDQFTDAPMAALAAAGDPASLNMPGIAFYDNYSVRQFPNDNIPPADLIPEPASIGMAGLALAALTAVGRSRKMRKQLA